MKTGGTGKPKFPTHPKVKTSYKLRGYMQKNVKMKVKMGKGRGK